MRRRSWIARMFRTRGMYATWAWILATNVVIDTFAEWALIPFTLTGLWLMYEIMRVGYPGLRLP